MASQTVVLHRVIRATPEKIYRAFLNAEAFAQWLPPRGFTAQVDHLDAKVGGIYKMHFTHFASGHRHAFSGEYLELVPNERIRYSTVFDDGNMAGAMRTTVALRQVFCGTDLNVVQEAIPVNIPTEACYLGWQESLLSLAELVEPEIPG